MSEPTGGKPHPYAEIIDLFRDTGAPAPAPAPAPMPAVVAPTPPRAPAHGPTSQPSRPRRALMLLPVALLAVAGGAAAVVMHQHDTASREAATPPVTSPTAASAAPVAAPPAPQSATAAGTEYSRALDRLSAAREPGDLATASRRVRAQTTDLRAATGRLARAEAAHLDALVALGTLDASTPPDLTSYARLTAAAQHASDAVTAAAGSREDVPDPSVATGNVVALTGRAVIDGLGTQVHRLADATAAAHLTAQLRVAAAQAEALVDTATSAASTVTDPHAATEATAYATALRALAALGAIDADHLTAWADLQGPLLQSLSAAGVPEAGDDVHAISAMVGAAQKKMDAWAAKSGGSVPVGSASPTSAQTQRAVKAAEAAAKAAASYATRADALVDRYAEAIATLPAVSPGQQPSYELAQRFNRTSRLLESLTSSVASLHAPAGMAGAQATLADLVARGRTAATTGQDLAISATECNPARRVCVLGSMSQWPAYKRAVGALGRPAAVRGTIAAGVRTAQAAVAAAGDGAGRGSAVTSEVPPKPIV